MIYNPGGFNADLVVTSDYKADGTATVVVTDTGGNELANVTSSDLGAALDTGRNMYLFACNGNTWLSDYFFGRCYYVKIWQKATVSSADRGTTSAWLPPKMR